jgi:hypothetical protein
MPRKRIIFLLVGLIKLFASVGARAGQGPGELFRQLTQDDRSIEDWLAEIGPEQLKKVLEARHVFLKQDGGVDFIVEATKNLVDCAIYGARVN